MHEPCRRLGAGRRERRRARQRRDPAPLQAAGIDGRSRSRRRPDLASHDRQWPTQPSHALPGAPLDDRELPRSRAARQRTLRARLILLACELVELLRDGASSTVIADAALDARRDRSHAGRPAGRGDASPDAAGSWRRRTLACLSRASARPRAPAWPRSAAATRGPLRNPGTSARAASRSAASGRAPAGGRPRARRRSRARARAPATGAS